ncbi:O-Antigen ligase [compost metagenome]
MDSSSSPRIIDRVVETLLGILLLVTPLLINVANVDAYRTVQATFASCLAALAVGAWCAGLTVTRRWREIARMPLLVPLGIFIAWLLVTATRSTAPGMSLLSGINVILYGGVFLAIADLSSRDAAARSRLLVTLLIPFALNSLAGILQYHRFDFMGLGRSLGLGGSPLNYVAGLDAPAKLGSAAGMLGNQNVLGDYLVVLLPVSVVLALTHFRSWKIVPTALTAILGIVALIDSLTRGAWVGTLVAGVLFGAIALAYGWNRLRQLGRKALVALGLVLVLGGGGALIVAETMDMGLGRAISKIQNTNASDRTVQQRLNAWDVAKLMAADNPVMGQGLGTYKIQYFNFLAKKFNDEPVPDMMQHRYVQAHNDLLQLAAETGYVGFLLGLGTLLAFAWGLLRFLWQRTLPARDALLVLGGLSGLTAMVLSAIFGFPFHIAASAAAFAAIAGLISGPWVAATRQSAPAASPDEPSMMRTMRRIVMPAAIGCFSLALVVAFYRPYQADMLVKKGMDLYQARQIPQARAALEEAVVLDNERGDAQMVLGIIYTAYQEYPKSVQMLNMALLSYDDVTLHYYLGRVYEMLNELQLAKKHYERATSYFPPSTEIYKAVEARLQVVSQQLPKP